MQQQPSKNLSKQTIKVMWVPIAGDGDDSSPFPFPVEWEIPVNIGLNAAITAVMTGFDTMVKEGAKSFEEFQEGKLDKMQFTYRMVHKGTQAAVKTGVRTGAGLTLSESTRYLIIKKWGEQAFRRLNKFNLVSALAFACVDQSTHTYNWYKGNLTLRDYKIKSLENIGSTGGVLGGAAVWAMVGSVVPGGTAFGVLLMYMLGVFGASSGASIGKQIGEEMFPEEDQHTEES